MKTGKYLHLGLDTGGTHTDAVIFDPRSETVLASAKAPTTHHDLSQGISRVLFELQKQKWPGGLQAVERLNLSTTLATNAIAENLSQPVGLFLIGYDPKHDLVQRLISELPLARPVFIKGGHDFYGQEEWALDESAIREAVRLLEPEVSGWAVSGFFSVKNPEHELKAAHLIGTESTKVVTLGRDLTGQLDAVKRAATAALNAGLVAILERLLAAVQVSAEAIGLKARLMVVRGDGRLVSRAWAGQKPIETVVSGPAAGILGANLLSRGLRSPEEKDAWVMDIGGTTTDLALVKDKRPTINVNGARIGRWETMTRAVETRTRGLGGDSLVIPGGLNKVSLGPRRVLPLCRLAPGRPESLVTLRRQAAEKAPRSTYGCFLLAGEPAGPGLSREERDLVRALAEKNLYALADYSQDAFEGRHHFLGLSAIKNSAILISAFTPTDALAVLGLYDQGSEEAARLGAELLGRHLGLGAEKTAELVLDEFGRLLAQEIASYGLELEGWTVDPDQFAPKGLLGGALGRWPAGAIEIKLRSRHPVIILGAPAAVLAPYLAKYLEGRIVVPPIHQAASAVGAAVAPIELSCQTEISVRPNFEGYRLFLPDGPLDGKSLDELVQAAEDRMRPYLYQLAELAGAGNPRLSVRREDRRVTLNDGSRLELGAIVHFQVEDGDRGLPSPSGASI